MDAITMFVGSADYVILTNAELREAGVRYGKRGVLFPRKNVAIMEDILEHYVYDEWLRDS